jgi:hypothetical protein
MCRLAFDCATLFEEHVTEVANGLCQQIAPLLRRLRTGWNTARQRRLGEGRDRPRPRAQPHDEFPSPRILGLSSGTCRCGLGICCVCALWKYGLIEAPRRALSLGRPQARPGRRSGRGVAARKARLATRRPRSPGCDPARPARHHRRTERRARSQPASRSPRSMAGTRTRSGAGEESAIAMGLFGA